MQKVHCSYCDMHESSSVSLEGTLLANAFDGCCLPKQGSLVARYSQKSCCWLASGLLWKGSGWSSGADQLVGVELPCLRGNTGPVPAQ